MAPKRQPSVPVAPDRKALKDALARLIAVCGLPEMPHQDDDAPVAHECPEPVGGGELIRGWAGICAEMRKSRVQIWRDIRAGRFPAPIELGPNSIAWFRREVEAHKASLKRRTYGAPGSKTSARPVPCGTETTGEFDQ